MALQGQTSAVDSRHLGSVILESMKKRPADDIFMIDAYTGSRMSVGDTLHQSVRLAVSLRRLALRPGDVLALAGRNHTALRLPYYAAIYNGLPVAGVDPLFKYEEIKSVLKTTLPRVIFCDEDAYEDYSKISQELNLGAKIFTFGDGDSSMTKLLEGAEASVEDFEPTPIDPVKDYAWLVSTSGTTGVLKLAAYTHASIVQTVQDFLSQGLVSTKIDQLQKLGLNFSPVEWISSYFNALMMPLINLALLQTSQANDYEHYVDLINTYKPSTVAINPSSLRSILYHEKHCDFTCFDSLTIAGEKAYPDMLSELQARVRPDTTLQQAYGQTEILGPVFLAQSSKGHPLDSCGTLWQDKKVKLVNPETRQEITEPNKAGELLVKGPVFTVVPPEIETVIITHPGVLDVAVTSVPDEQDGEHPVALVVARPDVTVTAQDIKRLVSDKLSTMNELRGGVVFIKELPMTVTGKVARSKLKHIAMSSRRE